MARFKKFISDQRFARGAKERHRKRRKQTVSGLLAAKPHFPSIKSKHFSYLEFVENHDKKPKKLELKITTDPIPPPGYKFVPFGDPALTSACKELSREQDAMIFIVSVGKQNKESKELSIAMNRVGYHVRETILQQARSSLGQNKSHSDPQHSDGSGPIPQSQEAINAQADATIRDLFPRIPNIDRQMIIERAFRKGAMMRGLPLVGLASDIALPRRVQLAVLAHIRHSHTRYDELLRETSWANARKAVEPICVEILVKWRGDEETGRDQLDEILREVIVISDAEDDEDAEPVSRAGVYVNEEVVLNPIGGNEDEDDGDDECDDYGDDDSVNDDDRYRTFNVYQHISHAQVDPIDSVISAAASSRIYQHSQRSHPGRVEHSAQPHATFATVEPHSPETAPDSWRLFERSRLAEYVTVDATGTLAGRAAYRHQAGRDHSWLPLTNPQGHGTNAHLELRQAQTRHSLHLRPRNTNMSHGRFGLVASSRTVFDESLVTRSPPFIHTTQEARHQHSPSHHWHAMHNHWASPITSFPSQPPDWIPRGVKTPDREITNYRDKSDRGYGSSPRHLLPLYVRDTGTSHNPPVRGQKFATNQISQPPCMVETHRLIHSQSNDLLEAQLVRAVPDFQHGWSHENSNCLPPANIFLLAQPPDQPTLNSHAPSNSATRRRADLEHLLNCTQKHESNDSLQQSAGSHHSRNIGRESYF